MALREIRLDGDPVLRKKARPVDIFGAHLHALLDDMAETMYDANGVGLAAPQIGVRRRVAVVDIGDGVRYELVNPEIVEQEGQRCGAEGCLSFPERSGYVRRPQKIRVQAQDREGHPLDIEAEGYLAVAMCHEIDHLNGILFTDKIIEPTEEEWLAMEQRTEEDPAAQQPEASGQHQEG